MKKKFIDAYMQVAEIFSQLSTARKLKVGAIIVKDERIISIGYNGTPSGFDNNCEVEHEDPMGRYALITKPEVLHAEANALLKVARSNENTEGSTLFCTHTPCLECAKLIYQSGISEVFIKTKYNSSKGSGEMFLINTDISITYL